MPAQERYEEDEQVPPPPPDEENEQPPPDGFWSAPFAHCRFRDTADESDAHGNRATAEKRVS